MPPASQAAFENNPLKLPRLENSTLLYEESLLRLRRDTLRIDSQPSYSYYVLETPPAAVVILASLTNGNFLLIEEYRHPTSKVLLSCPAGYIDANESPLEAAKRELLEETGYQAESFLLMGSAYPYAGLSGQKNYFVRAQGASFLQASQLEKSEIIRPVALSIQEITQAISQATTAIDGNLLTALYFNNLNSNLI